MYQGSNIMIICAQVTLRIKLTTVSSANVYDSLLTFEKLSCTKGSDMSCYEYMYEEWYCQDFKGFISIFYDLEKI